MSLGIYILFLVIFFIFLSGIGFIFFVVSFIVTSPQRSDEVVDFTEWPEGPYRIYKLKRDYIKKKATEHTGSNDRMIGWQETNFGFGKARPILLDRTDMKTFNNPDGSSLIFNKITKIGLEESKELSQAKNLLLKYKNENIVLVNENKKMKLLLQKMKEMDIENLKKLHFAITPKVVKSK